MRSACSCARRVPPRRGRDAPGGLRGADGQLPGHGARHPGDAGRRVHQVPGPVPVPAAGPGRRAADQRARVHRRQRRLMAPALPVQAHRRVRRRRWAACAEAGEAGWADGSAVDVSAEDDAPHARHRGQDAVRHRGRGPTPRQWATRSPLVVRTPSPRGCRPRRVPPADPTPRNLRTSRPRDPRRDHLAASSRAPRERPTGGTSSACSSPPRTRTARHDRRAGARRGDDDLPRRARDHGQRALVGHVPAGAQPRRARAGRAGGRRAGGSQGTGGLRRLSRRCRTPSPCSRRRCACTRPSTSSGADCRGTWSSTAGRTAARCS